MHPSVEYVCDLCPRETPAADRLKVTWGDKHYAVDLCKKHAREVGAVLAQWTANTKPVARRKTEPVIAGGYVPRHVREWAARKGIEIPPSGRIPNAIVREYLAQRDTRTGSRSSSETAGRGRSAAGTKRGAR